MGAVLETIFAGGVVFQRKIEKRRRSAGETRAPKVNPTPEAVRKLNFRNSVRTLLIKLMHNFMPGDYHMVFTYAGVPPTKEEAKGNMSRMKRKMRERYKASGAAFKWIETTEYKNKRIHHHLIVNAGVPVSEIQEMWEEYGTVHVRVLRKDRDWRKLAVYLIKETQRTFRDPDAYGRQRYTCSRNLSMPEVFEMSIPYSELGEEPKPFPGYYIDRDSIYHGINPVTEREYMEYIMLPINPYKVRKRVNGQKRKVYRNESYAAWLRENMPLQYSLEFYD